MAESDRPPCGFCEAYLTTLALNHMDRPGRKIRYHALYLDQRHSGNANGWRICGTTHYNNGHGWPLRFCPECGRGLDRRKLGREIAARESEIRRLFGGEG